MINISQLSNRQKTDYLNYLFNFMTDERKNKIMSMVENRTRHLTVILEDIFQPHNASAVLRSCDCFGIQDVHIIENRYAYNVNPDVALGSAKWLNLFRYNDNQNNTVNCISILKEKGYKIVATTPHEKSCMIDDLPLNDKTALLFGTEKEGLTEKALEIADSFVRIPMFGFTESLNISVSAAICLYSFISRLKTSDIQWKLNFAEKLEIMIEWAKNTIKKSDEIEKAYFK